MSKSMDTFFRANVGAVILNSQNQVLAFERSKIKGAWQLPQGGIKAGEEPAESVRREIEEETGLHIEELEFIAEFPEWLVYEVPKENRNKKVGRGQVQKWFFFRIINENETKIDLKKTMEKEFCNWQWISMKNLADIAVEFRRDIYLKLNYFIEKEIILKKK